MDAMTTHQGQSAQVLTAIIGHPYIFILSLLAVVCIFTRIKTTREAQFNNLKDNAGEPRSVPVVPYWAPYVGHTIGFALGFQDYLKTIAYKIPSGIMAIKIAGGTHNIIVSPSLTRELFNRVLPIDSEDIVWRFLEQSFGDHGLFRQWNKEASADLWELAKVIHGLMKEPFLSNAIRDIVTAVEDRTWNLISGTSSWVDHSLWERRGQVEIVSVSEKGGDFVAEADLFGLSRNFVGDLASTLLMGRAFLDNNPTFLDDLWLFDSKVHLMMLGLPAWMIPGVPAAIAARERCIEAVREHHKAMIDVIEGKDPGYRYSDLSDVSSLIWDRAKGFHQLKNVSRVYGVGDLVMVWAMNVNANQVIFWMMYFIYQNPELLKEVRAELEPYVKLRESASEGLPIKAAPRLNIDIEGVLQKCPLLKGAFYETMRMEVVAASYRVAKEDFILNESKEDALKMGKATPDRYIIKKGEILAVPMQVQQFHPVYYEKPDEFNARRFWVKKKDEKGDEHISVEYGSMRPWGGGTNMCKGRNFAEREVLAFAASILMVWEMEAAGKNGWKHPGHQFTTGTFTPKRDVRVRMWRRKW